jgi:hypothetical protein
LRRLLSRWTAAGDQFQNRLTPLRVLSHLFDVVGGETDTTVFRGHVLLRQFQKTRGLAERVRGRIHGHPSRQFHALAHQLRQKMLQIHPYTSFYYSSSILFVLSFAIFDRMRRTLRVQDIFLLLESKIPMRSAVGAVDFFYCVFVSFRRIQ